MWGITPLDHLYYRVRYAQARYEGPYTPAGLTHSVQHPAAFGAISTSCAHYPNANYQGENYAIEEINACV